MTYHISIISNLILFPILTICADVLVPIQSISHPQACLGGGELRPMAHLLYL